MLFHYSRTFCFEGTWFNVKSNQFYFYLSGSAAGVPCPPGHYCELGTYPKKCPIHRYRDIPGGKTLNDCLECPAGHWCNVTGMNNYNNSRCPLGYYCLRAQKPTICPAGRHRNVPGAKNVTDCFLCPGGHYCPENRTNINGIICRATYYCQLGSAFERVCPAGKFCKIQTEDPTICPGMYSPGRNSRLPCYR